MTCLDARLGYGEQMPRAVRGLFARPQGPSAAALRAKRRRARMTRKQRRAECQRKIQSAKRLREALIIELAPDLRCAKCGEQFEVCQLQVDHVDGKAWRASKLSLTSRVARYWREYRAGIPMRALCSLCNCRDGWCKRFGVERPEDEVPF